MLRLEEKSRYTSYIAMPERLPGGEFFAVHIGRFISRGGFDFRQAAGGPSLHLIRRGQGVFVADGVDYPVQPGELFCLCAGVDYHYYDLPESPWEYFWINFGGSRAAGLLEEAGFSAATPKGGDPGCKALACAEYWHGELERGGSGTAAAAAAWDMLYRLDRAGRAPEPLAERVRRQIDNALYAFPTVQELAETFGVSRSHLYRIFSAAHGCSVQDYLARRRLERTCDMLEHTSATLDEIAASCGWSNRQYCIRNFRRATGLTPKNWRNRMTAERRGKAVPPAAGKPA